MTTTSDLLNADVPSRTSYIGTLANAGGTITYTATGGPVKVYVTGNGGSAGPILINGASLWPSNSIMYSAVFLLGTGQTITVYGPGANANATVSVETSK